MEDLNPTTETPAPKRETSTLAIMSLIFAIVVCCFPPLALTVGIIALVKIKRNRATLKGKGLAIAGIIISILIMIAIIVPNIISHFSPHDHYMDGIDLIDYGDYNQAISEFTRAIELKPDYAEAYKGRGDTYYRQKEYDKAIADWEQAIKLDPSYEEELRINIEEAKQAKEKK
jgi:tetratricopeptide (TPR) repeat protein